MHSTSCTVHYAQYTKHKTLSALFTIPFVRYCVLYSVLAATSRLFELKALFTIPLKLYPLLCAGCNVQAL